MKLTVILVVIFSYQGFSQTTEKSSHPLLDKYYPQPKTETREVVSPAGVPVTPPPATVVPQKAIVTPAQTPTVNVSPTPEPTTTVTIVRPTVDTTMNTTTVDLKNTTPVITNQPTVVATPAAAPAPVVVAPPPPDSKYNRSRLGSSSPQYNTWEKNSNGAGSVTTHSK